MQLPIEVWAMVLEQALLLVNATRKQRRTILVQVSLLCRSLHPIATLLLFRKVCIRSLDFSLTELLIRGQSWRANRRSSLLFPGQCVRDIECISLDGMERSATYLFSLFKPIVYTHENIRFFSCFGSHESASVVEWALKHFVNLETLDIRIARVTKTIITLMNQSRLRSVRLDADTITDHLIEIPTLETLELIGRVRFSVHVYKLGRLDNLIRLRTVSNATFKIMHPLPRLQILDCFHWRPDITPDFLDHLVFLTPQLQALSFKFDSSFLQPPLPLVAMRPWPKSLVMLSLDGVVVTRFKTWIRDLKLKRLHLSHCKDLVSCFEGHYVQRMTLSQQSGSNASLMQLLDKMCFLEHLALIHVTGLDHNKLLKHIPETPLKNTLKSLHVQTDEKLSWHGYKAVTHGKMIKLECCLVNGKMKTIQT
ncbi:hypothetical protein EDD86DRAFT_203218 [Gorgonomyces haynaldii]|nr:hypothetical protein EDD86DRAFT_203218 [Gorgonomyces haynaldii]